MCREFLERHRDLVEYINVHYEGMWTEVADLMTRIREQRVTTRGTVVREFPPTREIETQVEVATSNHTSETQTGPAEPGPSMCQEKIAEPDRQSVERTRRNSEKDIVFVRKVNPVARGCWNCRQEGHKYTRCPRLDRGQFCYGCGQRNTTIKTCPRCGPYYAEKGPFKGYRNPRDRSPTQGR